MQTLIMLWALTGVVEQPQFQQPAAERQRDVALSARQRELARRAERRQRMYEVKSQRVSAYNEIVARHNANVDVYWNTRMRAQAQADALYELNYQQARNMQQLLLQDAILKNQFPARHRIEVIERR